LAYHCPKCKLLFSTLPECCPDCAGTVCADLRLDRYYLEDGFQKYTGVIPPSVKTPQPVTKTEPVIQTPPAPKAVPVAKSAPVTPTPPAPTPTPVSRPKIKDDDTLASLRDAYYRQHGGSQPTPPDPPKPNSGAASGSSFFDNPGPPPHLSDLPNDPKPSNPEPPHNDPPPVSPGNSFFDDPDPAPYVPDLPEEPQPSEPVPPIEPEPMPRQRAPRGTGAYSLMNALANVRWGCVFRVLLVLVVIAAIVALIANLDTIVSGILDLFLSLLPGILIIGGIIYLLRSLFRGR